MKELFSNFTIFGEIYLLDENEQCLTYASFVPKASSNKSENYVCSKCNCHGSFIRLKKNLLEHLFITDIKIKGILLRKSGNKIKKRKELLFVLVCQFLKQMLICIH